MKFRRRFGPVKSSTFNIADAVEAECSGYDLDRGALEAAAETAENTSRLLGSLIRALNDTGVLHDAQVVRLLPGFEAVSEEDR